MSRLVLDCSIVIAWVIRESEPAERADKVFEQIAKFGGVVPAIWPLEVANVLHVAERRGRIQSAATDEFLVRLSQAPMTIEATSGEVAFRPVLKLARSLRISAYDAAYLELAARHAVPIATFDKRLAEAAKSMNVPVL